ncbi:arginine--tRNA ligase [Xylocopilactobacillus apicola]|uniref:Arginine--tRNA ligase n=1 Tax=Xylocopilactobacillus apicola TaxID=2932184 RepID=A0AAU9DF15_9LACO|nr:arginine--tRNA ligase [Xylocopilactobacillus apicola]BDR58500.1 arginine--tRNA ligase [Xylocopilactobacillus apicola]
MSLENVVVQELKRALSIYISDEVQVENLLERPKNSSFGDFSFPTFSLAKVKHKSPNEIASEIVALINQNLFKKINIVNGYINFFVLREKDSEKILTEINQKKADYGSNNEGNGQNVTIDMSSPNIAKPMSMGHLRSTVIGNSLANIEKKCGYEPVKINFLGDWGTQFGKLLAAYKMWGVPEEIEDQPIETLLKLYVHFNQEAKKDESLNDLGRAWFKKLEDGDSEALKLWEWFRKVSLQRFEEIYNDLDIHFDSYDGEAFYNDKMAAVIDRLKTEGILEESQGAQVVDLSAEGFDNPALIIRSDGASLYITRDLAAAIYRKNKYKSVKSLYVVGSEQKQHFAELKAVLKKMGYSWAEQVIHVPFGLITFNGKKLSTREGRIVLLNDVLNKSFELALKQIEEKNPTLENKELVARQVGYGAVVFHDLKNDRLENFDFKLDEVVQFEGDTGPYVQYTNARAQSILRKASKLVQPTEKYVNIFEDDSAFDVIKLLDQYPTVIRQAEKKYEPSAIAKYSIQLAKSFNHYYKNVRILVEGDELFSRLQMVRAVSYVLQDSLSLLGVKAPSEM